MISPWKPIKAAFHRVFAELASYRLWHGLRDELIGSLDQRVTLAALDSLSALIAEGVITEYAGPWDPFGNRMTSAKNPSGNGLDVDG